jgi:hypothetical protein
LVYESSKGIYLSPRKEEKLITEDIEERFKTTAKKRNDEE